MKIFDLTAHEVRDKLRNRELSSVELTEESYKRIDAVESKVDSFITFTKKEAFLQAKAFDERMKKGELLGDLAGIPMALKDNMCTDGILTTCASKILGNFTPPYDATVTQKLKNAGAVIVGKTNMDEFAMGSSTENSAYKTTKNPWDTDRVPGGSSGGSAASVASGEVFYSLGSDTGGSIRQPAAFTGLVGLKPTYGRVSRYGLVAFASSLDQIGPLGKDVEDCALVMNTISGHDRKDSTSIDRPVPDFALGMKNGVKGMRIGIPKEFFGEGIDEEVKTMVLEAARLYESMGAVCEEISLPSAKHALSVYYILATSECSSNLARFDGARYGYRAKNYEGFKDMFIKTRSQGFGEEVKRRIMLGTYSLSSGYYDAYYNRGLKVRTLIKQEFEKAFETYDFILTPTTPTTAFKIGEKSDDPLEMYMSDICTVPVNIAGVPAISLPCGFKDGLPVGMQLIGKFFDEATLIRAAYSFEKASVICRQRASIMGGGVNEL
ncbi:MAG: Asp-tRNA(Asn)/Glu-tRNA(Gln) amidotransferase subunit GatA [Peptostreptococcaceae bacterium]|nr:Asp-tRNA(Asn)/Glu-tRNA(Gln) amidotransferase subunit GatA [Peptostreptococcaceae bacterium]